MEKLYKFGKVIGLMEKSCLGKVKGEMEKQSSLGKVTGGMGKQSSLGKVKGEMVK